MYTKEEIKLYINKNNLKDYLNNDLRSSYQPFHNLNKYYQEEASMKEKIIIENYFLDYFYNGNESEFYFAIFTLELINYKLIINDVYEMVKNSKYRKYNEYTKLFLLEIIFKEKNKNDIGFLLREYDKNDSLYQYFLLIGDYEKPNCVTYFDLFMLNKLSDYYENLSKSKKNKLQEDFFSIPYYSPQINTLFEVFLLKNNSNNLLSEFVKNYLRVKNT